MGKTREGCWQTSGRSPSFRGLPEACLADPRKVPGRRPEGSWQTSGRFLADVRKMPRRPLWKASEKRWEDLGRPVADLWKMTNETRAYRGIAVELPSGLPKAFLPLPHCGSMSFRDVRLVCQRSLPRSSHSGSMSFRDVRNAVGRGRKAFGRPVEDGE